MRAEARGKQGDEVLVWCCTAVIITHDVSRARAGVQGCRQGWEPFPLVLHHCFSLTP